MNRKARRKKSAGEKIGWPHWASLEDCYSCAKTNLVLLMGLGDSRLLIAHRMTGGTQRHRSRPTWCFRDSCIRQCTYQAY